MKTTVTPNFAAIFADKTMGRLTLSLSASLCLFLFLATCFTTTSAGATWTYPKTTVLEFFSSWRTQISEDRFLDERERDLRIELVDRVSFQIDRKYLDQDFKTFLIETTSGEALANNNATDHLLANERIVLHNLNSSLKEILEPSENILSFVRSFIEYSGLKYPRPLEGFADSRSYTNGVQTETANSLDLDGAARLAQEEAPEVFDPDTDHDDSYAKYYNNMKLEYELPTLNEIPRDSFESRTLESSQSLDTTVSAEINEIEKIAEQP